MTNLEWALKYAGLGWHVFPCNIDKTPKTVNGLHDATIDQAQIRCWWEKWPDASIGLATGKISGVWVLDIDEYKQAGTLDAFRRNSGNSPIPSYSGPELADIIISGITMATRSRAGTARYSNISM